MRRREQDAAGARPKVSWLALVALSFMSLSGIGASPAAAQEESAPAEVRKPRCISALERGRALLPNGWLYKGNDGPYFDCVADADLALPPHPTLEKMQEARGALRTNLMRSSRLEGDIMKLIAGFDEAMGDRPRPKNLRVIMRASDQFNAVAMADGSIIVDIGLFESAENIDQFAFLIAHEYAHIALGHMNEDRLFMAQRKYLRYLTYGAQAGSAMTKMDQNSALQSRAQKAELKQDLDRIQAAHNTSRYISDVLVEPGWGRTNEDEADLFAYDLMAKAGFAPDGALTAIAKREERRVLAEMRLKLANEVMSCATRAVALGLQAADTSGASGLGNVLKAFGETLLDAFSRESRARLVEWLTGQHRSPEVRAKGLAAYARSAHAEEMPAVTTPAFDDAWLAKAEKDQGYRRRHRCA